MRPWPAKLVLLIFCLGGALAAAVRAQVGDDAALVNEINLARYRLQAQQPALAPGKLERAAELLGRSNYLARAIETALRGNELSKAARLWEQFPGKVDDLRSYGNPLIYQAALDGNEARLDFLLERKADPNVRSLQGDTPLGGAINFRHWTIALQLVQAGAVVTGTNAYGQSPLSVLAQQWPTGQAGEAAARVKLLQALLERGADPFAPSGLREGGAIVEAALSREGGGILSGLGASLASSALPPICDLMLTNSADPARRTPAGDTALHLATRWARTNALDFLLAAGFSVNQTNNDGLTPLQSIADSVREQTGGPQPVGLGQRAQVFTGRGWGPPGMPPTPAATAELLLGRGAALDVFCAAGLGRTNELAAWLSSDPSLANARDGLGRTPLHYAISGQRHRAARRLLQSGADPSAATLKPIPGLHREALIAAGTTPLHLAALRGDPELIRLLLQAHARVGAVDQEGNTALHLAAQRSQTSCLDLLVAGGAPLEATNRAGQTALAMAVESGLGGNVDLLLKAGARPGGALGSNTLLHIAAERGSTDVIAVLLRHGLAVDTRDGEGRTAFQRAVMFRKWSAINLLRSRGANINAADAAGDTALHLVSTQQDDTAARQVEQQFWVRWEREWLSRPGLGQQALSRLVQWKVLPLPSNPAWTNISLTIWLLDHHTDPNRTNRLGQTPLHILCGQPWLYNSPKGAGRVAALLSRGANPNLTDLQGRTPLHEAVAGCTGDFADRQNGVLLALLTNRADPNLQDHQGLTPLHVAFEMKNAKHAASGNDYVASLLLTNGAQPNLRDRDGRTPMHLLAGMSGPWAHPGGYLDSVLLNGKWDFAARDHAGETPIHLWASNLDTGCSACRDLLRNIITNAALANLTNAAGDTPLHTALRANRYGTVELLMQAGADPARRNARGETAFRLVAALGPANPLVNLVRPAGAAQTFWNTIYGHDEASFDRWLEADAGLCSITNASGQTPLMAATEQGLTNFADRLLAMGARLDLLSAMRLGRWDELRQQLAELRESPPSPWLFEAVRIGNRRALEDLVAAGGDVQATDAEGHSLLYHASVRRQVKLAEWFQARGCRETLFDALARGDYERVDGFLRADTASVNATNRQGRPLLLLATIGGDTNLVRLLLARGANADCRTSEGWTALHIAAAQGSVEVGRQLLQAGLDPNELARAGMGPLHIAAAYGRTEFAELLLQHGAQVNLRPPAAPGVTGNSPLHWAVHKGQVSTVKLLLSHGADFKATNNTGLTPAAWAHRMSLSTFSGFPSPAGVPVTFTFVTNESVRAAVLRALEEAAAGTAK